MDFDLRDMEYFVQTASEKSFTKAAEKLYIAQPALSRKINALETSLGLKLFERSTRSVELTDAGQAFLRHSRHVLQECAQLEQEMESIRHGAQGVVRLGYRSRGQFDYLMRIVAAMHKKYPGIQVQVCPGCMLEQLYSGSVDAVLMMNFECKGSDWLRAVSLDRAGLMAFLPADSPRGKTAGEISVTELLQERFVLPLRRGADDEKFVTSLYDRIRDYLIAQGVSVENITVASDAQDMTMRVIAGEAVGIMPDSSHVIANELMVARPIHECRTGFDVVTAWRRKDEQSAPLQALQKILQEHL